MPRLPTAGLDFSASLEMTLGRCGGMTLGRYVGRAARALARDAQGVPGGSLRRARDAEYRLVWEVRWPGICAAPRPWVPDQVRNDGMGLAVWPGCFRTNALGAGSVRRVPTGRAPSVIPDPDRGPGDPGRPLHGS